MQNENTMEVLNTTANVYLNACAQGLTELDRIANHIYLRSMTLRYYLTQDSAQENPSLVRMVIFVIRDGAALATLTYLTPPNI